MRPTNASVVDEAEGRVVFPSRADTVFHYRLSLTTNATLVAWLEGLTTKQQ